MKCNVSSAPRETGASPPETRSIAKNALPTARRHEILRTHRVPKFFLVPALLAAGAPGSVRGQSMSSLLESLFDYIECGAPLCLQSTTGDPGRHDSHFVPENSPSNAAVISFLTGVLNEVPGNMPLATPFLGRVLADEEDPGPTRLLRAMTLGRGRFNLGVDASFARFNNCLLYTSPSPRERTRSRMPSSA